MNKTKRLLLVAGNIGAGKTSLPEHLAARLGRRTSFEAVVDHPYLAAFYADMARWEVRLRVVCLGRRA